ncbi:MAG: hypothetical protein K6E76_01805 [Patescibacteria group bacterium]|nr:hypothetical protein [Patescibacteria group bacterium]
MAISVKFMIRRQGLLVVTVLVLLLSACIEIDCPAPQYPANQNQPIVYVTDSSKVEINLDSAFVLNQKIIDSSYSYIDARSNVENNGASTTVLGGGGENGGGSASITSKKTEILTINDGILVKIKDSKNLQLLYEPLSHWQFQPRDLDEITKDITPTDPLVAIFSLGFAGENNNQELRFHSKWQGRYLGGETNGEVVLAIDDNQRFRIIPESNIVGSNYDTYFGGLMGSHGEDAYQMRRRTLAGITASGELLILVCNATQAEAYQLLCIAGADPAQTITLDAYGQYFDNNLLRSATYRSDYKCLLFMKVL